MNLQNYYYYFQSALTPRFCDELIKYGASKQSTFVTNGLFLTRLWEKLPHSFRAQKCWTSEAHRALTQKLSVEGADHRILSVLEAEA